MKKVDRPFLITVVILVVAGFFIFTSASLGLLEREGARFSSVAVSQILFGIVGGSIALFITSQINYKFWKKFSLPLFILSILGTLSVFIPGFGFEYNGAKRWIDIGITTIQPAEFLKIGFVLYLATWLSNIRTHIKKIKYGLLPFAGILGIVAFVLLIQPDTGTFLVIGATGVVMFIIAGAKIRDVFLLGISGIGALAVLAYFRPYIQERLFSFINPSHDPLGVGYQIQQSLIAIGSGGFFGRGFGQSLQKFSYLPEPIGDSIFSVAAEEFGFIGASAIIILFLFLAFRGLRIASRAPDYFSGLLVAGIVILIVSQSFLNIGSMLAVFPLTGLPLLFVSHGGTAMFLTLASVGIILNVSKYQRK